MGQASRRKWEARLQRAQNQVLRSLKLQPITIIRATGIAALLMGVGFAMIFSFFWPGVVLIYAGAIVLAFDLYWETWHLRWKILGLAVPISIIFIVSVWAWSPAPLSIQTNRHPGNHSDGQVIGGIPWKSTAYSELRVSFTNESDNNYEELDAYIDTDLETAEAGFIDAAPTCLLRPPSPRILDARTTAKDKEGRVTEKLMPQATITRGPYHLHCDKLINRDSIQIVFAIVNLNVPDKKTDKSEVFFGTDGTDALFGPKKLPLLASVAGTYKSVFRPFSFSLRNNLSGG